MKANDPPPGWAERSLNFQHLRYFWAVAREGNLTRAAERLHVSQSAVSVQLRKLEEAVGHELFERRGRSLTLTQAGRVALDYADGIFSLGDELLGVLDEAADARQATLRIGALATLSRNFQHKLLSTLLARQDVQVTVRSGALADLVQRLEAHRLDVVLTNAAPARQPDSSWVAHIIDQQPVSLIGQRRRRRGKRLEQLLAEEPLVLPTIESGIRAGFDALVERIGVRPHIIAEVDDMAMLRLVARSHEGLAVIPPIVVKDELEQGSLIEVQRLPDLMESFLALTAPRRLRHPLLGELLGARPHDEP